MSSVIIAINITKSQHISEQKKIQLEKHLDKIEQKTNV